MTDDRADGTTLRAPRVVTEPLGGTPLSIAAAEGRAPADWYVPRPLDADAWARRASAVRDSTRSGWADALLPALAPSGRAAERLREVIDRGGLVVTTGQQPGLFGGPIYTWSKALSALALANELEEASGLPVAPIFWAATDDSDFAEASWTLVARPGGVDELTMESAPAVALSMTNVPLGDVSTLVAGLARGAGSISNPEPLAIARRAYRPDQTVGGAYVELLRGMLEPLGIVVLDAGHPAVRRASSPLLRTALDRSDAIAAALEARERALRAAGHSVQVTEVAGLSLVFQVVDGERRRVRRIDAPGLARRATDDELSANVLLRPVVERYLLPTAAYVAGPAELAYFAQSSAVADALGAQRPLALPRWSGTIIEPHVERILARHGISGEDLRDPHEIETRLARASLPQNVSSALARMRAAVDESIAAIGHVKDPLLPPSVVEGARRSIEHRIRRLERRYAAAAKRTMTDAMHDIATARGSLYPAGKRQERALNLLPLLARYGPALWEAMRAAASAHAASIVSVRRANASGARGDPSPEPATSRQ